MPLLTVYINHSISLSEVRGLRQLKKPNRLLTNKCSPIIEGALSLAIQMPTVQKPQAFSKTPLEVPIKEIHEIFRDLRTNRFNKIRNNSNNRNNSHRKISNSNFKRRMFNQGNYQHNYQAGNPRQSQK